LVVELDVPVVPDVVVAVVPEVVVTVVAVVTVDDVSVTVPDGMAEVPVVSVVLAAVVLTAVSVVAVSVLTASSFLQPNANIVIATRASRVINTDFFIGESSPCLALFKWAVEGLQIR
jgi:hypothetical protein